MDVKKIRTIDQLETECIKVNASILLTLNQEELKVIEKRVSILETVVTRFQEERKWNDLQRETLGVCREWLEEARENLKEEGILS